MKKFTLIVLFFCFGVMGCADISPRDNVSPKLQQQIDNQNGKIEHIESNQNAIKAQIDRISFINKENSGIQILQGDGALITIFGLGTIIAICVYFYKTAESYKKAAQIFADEISVSGDQELKDRVLMAAKHTEVEGKVCSLIRRL